MKNSLLLCGILIVLLTPFAFAQQDQNYLLKKCESIIPGDFVSSIAVEDIEKRGTLNILAGTSYNGVLYNFVYDKNTNCYDEWSPRGTFNTEGDIESIVVDDADSDGKIEILLNGQASKKEKKPDNYVYVLNMKDGTLLPRWDYKRTDAGCFYSSAVDFGGWSQSISTEKVVITGGAESRRVCVFINWSKNQRVVSSVSDMLDNPIEYIISSDINKDGYNELVVLTTNNRNLASVYVLSGVDVSWKYAVDGGVRTQESTNLWIDDLNGDGKQEILVGTFNHGVDVLDTEGKLLWNFKTASTTSKTDIVSKVRTYRYFLGSSESEKPKVIVAAKPYIYLLDGNGQLLWKAQVNTTVFDFDYGDLDGDGKNELVAGATSYIYIYSDTGELKGMWSYAAEIQGLTGSYKKRDMDTVHVAVYDFDNDNKQEIFAAFKWFDDQLDLNIPQGSVRVFEINPDYKPSTTASTTEATQATQQTTATSMATNPTTPQTTIRQGTTPTTIPAKKSGGMCPCLPFLPAVLAFGVAIAAGIPLALVRK